jgi:hypothetical protein
MRDLGRTIIRKDCKAYGASLWWLAPPVLSSLDNGLAIPIQREIIDQR